MLSQFHFENAEISISNSTFEVWDVMKIWTFSFPNFSTRHSDSGFEKLIIEFTTKKSRYQTATKLWKRIGISRPSVSRPSAGYFLDFQASVLMLVREGPDDVIHQNLLIFPDANKVLIYGFAMTAGKSGFQRVFSHFFKRKLCSALAPSMNEKECLIPNEKH